MRYKSILELARYMRTNPTTSELFFWNKVRNRSFHGFKFYRQYIVESANINGDKSFFIGDFYCHNKKVIIELDGKIHLTQLEYDKLREKDLIEMGFKIIRFKNEEVLNNWQEVSEILLKEIS